MNRYCISLCFGLLATAGVQAQTTITAASVSGFAGSTVNVPLTVSAFSAVAGLELHVTDNGAGFSPQEVTSTVLEGMTVGILADQINVVWDDYTNPLTLADGDTLAVVSYLLAGSIGDTTPLTFSGCEMADEFGEVIAGSYVDGALSIVPPQPPSAFNLLSPADGSVVSQNQQQVSWEASVNDNEGTQLYTVYLSTDPELNGANSWSDQEATSFTFPSLEDNAQYYWSVLAQDVDTDGTMANQIWSFQTVIPDCPHLIEAFADQEANEDESLYIQDFLGYYEDADGDELMLINMTDNVADADFGWAMEEGYLVVTPPANWNGAVTFTLTVSDGGCNTVDELNAAFAAVNDAPVAPAIEDASIDEDTSFSLLWEPVDVEQDPIDISFQLSNENLSAMYHDDISTITVTPAADWYGTATVTINISDGELDASTSFELQVVAVNDAPVVTLSTGPSSGCGVVSELGHFEDATSGFIVDLSSGAISVEVQDVDDSVVTFSAFINDDLVFEGDYAIGTIPDISSLDFSDYYDSDITLYFTVEDEEFVWNENGEECQWELNFLALPESLPLCYSLAPCAPNPFNPSTQIAFTLPQSSDVSLRIYNLRGQMVDELIHQTLPAGEHHLQWQAGENASGCYLLLMQAGEFHQVQRLLLVR